MEAVGTILALISVVTFGAGVWGLIRGRFARAHILSRKVAGGVLAGSLGLMAAAGAVLPNEDDVRVVTYGREQLAAPADDTTTTTTAPEPPTSTSAPTSTTTTGPATTISKPVPIAPVPTKTTSRPVTTTRPTTTTSRPATTTTTRLVTTTTAPKVKASCAASVANPNPSSPGGNETVNVVSSLPNSGFVITLHYKTTVSEYSGTTDGSGAGSVTFQIGRATEGYAVKADVKVGGAATCSTQFIPV